MCLKNHFLGNPSTRNTNTCINTPTLKQVNTGAPRGSQHFELQYKNIYKNDLELLKNKHANCRITTHCQLSSDNGDSKEGFKVQLRNGYIMFINLR